MTDPTIEILSGPETGLSPKYPQFSTYQERLQGRAGVSVSILLSEEVETGRSLMRQADSTLVFIKQSGSFKKIMIRVILPVMSRKQTERPSGKASRFFFIALGWAMVGLGILGAILPILPTTPFILVALWAFARSSPRFEQWVLDHETFGPLARNWRERGAIPKRAKILACATMAFSYAIFWFFTEPGLLLALLLAAVLLSVALFLVTRPN